jgi:hypothetical protein
MVNTGHGDPLAEAPTQTPTSNRTTRMNVRENARLTPPGRAAMICLVGLTSRQRVNSFSGNDI